MLLLDYPSTEKIFAHNPLSKISQNVFYYFKLSRNKIGGKWCQVQFSDLVSGEQAPRTAYQISDKTEISIQSLGQKSWQKGNKPINFTSCRYTLADILC